MKISKLALSLTLISSFLVACGGGGDSRSPDRPPSRLDPSSLRIDFPNGNVLPGTGNNSIPVRMVGLQTDGVETNLGPELNVTSNTQWSLGGQVGDPAIAALAAAIRDAGTIGNVQDILSSVRLSSNDTAKTLTITGVHNSSNVSRTRNFTIQPPIPLGAPFISGPNIIPLNPNDPNASFTTNYQLLQDLQDVAIDENLTNEVRWCANNSNASYAEEIPTTGSATVTFTNPFVAGSPQPVSIELFAVDDTLQCSAGTNNPSQKVASKVVQVIPATVQSLSVCALTNPPADACDAGTGALQQELVSACRGLNTGSVEVPAGQNLQLAARITYQNADGTTSQSFQCSSPSLLTWGADPDTIFLAGPDSQDGDAQLISRDQYLEIQDQNPQSTVTGTYTNNTDATNDDITDSLTLRLVDAQVIDVEIVRTSGDADEIPLNILGTELEFTLMCTFQDINSQETEVCPDAFVDWTVSPTGILEADPSADSAQTTVSAVEEPSGDGIVTLTASYNDGVSGALTDQVAITTIQDDIVEVFLLQVSNGSNPDIRNEDGFSCVGRTDLVGTIQDGENYLRGSQQYYVHALFESDEATYNGDPSTLPDITGSDAVFFSAVSGYSDNNGACLTGPIPGGEFPTGDLPGFDDLPGFGDLPTGDFPLPIPGDFDFPEFPGGGDVGPAAAFDTETKGELRARGLLRLSTVCVQAYVDTDGNREFDEDSSDLLANSSATTLVLPAADDDLLLFSNELCETLEPVLTLGAGVPGASDFLPAGAVIPLVYGVSLIADPLLATLATNDDGGLIPGEEIVQALITGEFSAINEQFPDSPIGGLGVITNALLGDAALGPVVDALDACLLDPTTTGVSALLTALLTANPDALGFPEIGSQNCDEAIGGFGAPGDFGGLEDLFSLFDPSTFFDFFDGGTDGLPGPLQDLFDMFAGLFDL